MSSSEPTTRRWRLDVAYDGGAFHGFADQPAQATVAGALSAALATTLRLAAPPRLTVAGRTDTGVHALANVVTVDLPTPLFADDRGDPGERLRRSVNHQLDGRVEVLRAEPVPTDFDARHSAQWRAYRYLVVEGAAELVGPVGRLAWAVAGPFDEAALALATAAVVGTHDFGAFCRRPPDADLGAALVRDVHAAAWSTPEDVLGLLPSGARWRRFDIRANAFCHQMVRSLVGTLVAVAVGRLAAGEVAARLAAPSRDGLPAPAPPHGLALAAVGYGSVAGHTAGPVT